ncbi:helix-turn-helix domain-containing protein [Nocardia mikamii]|uniref:helix-turn-helix domain-containing protein n=1 Tax=Nocardia mikamii TaxID=508464 RepID=UPI000B2B10DA
MAVPAKYNAEQRRIIVAAFELFARHGVGATSLQMLADYIGVTKAAVYHQFKSNWPAVDRTRADITGRELPRLRHGARSSPWRVESPGQRPGEPTQPDRIHFSTSGQAVMATGTVRHLAYALSSRVSE